MPQPTSPSANQDPFISRSPKARFMESGDNISRHRAMIDTREFERGTDYAAANYATYLAMQVKNGETAMAVGFRLMGAMEFLQTLKTLADVPRVITPKVTDNLNHNA